MVESCPNPLDIKERMAHKNTDLEVQMLPLFGRTGRKTTAAAIINDEWCIPSDQELFGRSSRTNDVVLETVNEVSNENNSTISTTGVTTSFQSMNDTTVMVDGEVMFSNITTVDGEDTFSIMNNETTIVNAMEDLEIIEDDGALETEVISNAMDVDLNLVLMKIRELERKYEVLHSRLTEYENSSSQKAINVDSTTTIFANEFLGILQDLMRNGIAYQQGVLGKFIDEIDGMFDINFSNFDPFK